MYIPCKSCGQQLYIPDDANNLTVRCPSCQKEFAYTAEAMANENENVSADSSAAVIDQTPPDDPLPEYATRASYHQPRNLVLQPFSCMDAMLAALRIFKQHFGAIILMVLILSIPNFLMSIASSTLLPQLPDTINKILSEDHAIEEAIQLYKYAYQHTPPVVLFLYGVSSTLLGIFQALLFVGCVRLFNAYGRNQKVSFWLIFSGFDSPIRVLIALIQLYLLFMAFSLFGIVLMVIGASALVIVLLFTLPILIILFLFFLIPLIADTNLSANKAFQLSCYIAQRNFLALLGLIFLVSILYMLILFVLYAFLGVFISPIYLLVFSVVLLNLVLLGLTSVSYLKATGQFRE